MKESFLPWLYLARSLVLRSPNREHVHAAPYPVSAGMEPPPRLADGDNGYVRLVRHLADWPSEGHHPVDLIHRRKQLPKEREEAARALSPLRPLLEGLEPIFAMPWQVLLDGERSFPELRSMRRLGQALLLRAALEERSDDHDAALRLAERLRTAQSPMIHFIAGIAVEKLAEGPFTNIAVQREEAIHWELRRYILPFIHESGAWRPVTYETTPIWQDDLLATRWLLSQHPKPYDAAATAQLFLAEEKLMASGSAVEIQKRAEVIGADWPVAMANRTGGWPQRIPMRTLFEARERMLDADNPFGRLSVARTMYWAASIASAVERAKPR